MCLAARRYRAITSLETFRPLSPISRTLLRAHVSRISAVAIYSPVKGDKEIIWFANSQRHDAKQGKGERSERAKQAGISAMIDNAKSETFALLLKRRLFSREQEEEESKRETKREGKKGEGERKKLLRVTLLLKHS